MAHSTRGWILSAAALLSAATAGAFEPKQSTTDLADKEFFLPELTISTSTVPVADVIDRLPNRAAWRRLQAARAQAGAEPVNAYIEPRTGSASSIIGSFPLIPGAGNSVTLRNLSRTLGRTVKTVDAKAVGDAALLFVKQHAEVLGIDTAQLGAVKAGAATPDLWHVSIPQVVNGVPVRFARVVVTIKHGNVVLMGTSLWKDVSMATTPVLDAVSAEHEGFAYAGGRQDSDRVVQGTKLELVPIAPPEMQKGEGFGGSIGRGLGHRLVWTFQFQRELYGETWEAMVDANSGNVIAFEDKNQYVDRKIVGGIYPLTNTEVCPTPQTCGVMQPGSPMAFDDTGFVAPNNFTDSGGIYNYTSGTATTTNQGQFVRTTDTCGVLSLSSATGDVDLLGTNGQHDCTTPGVGGAGNTSASRSGFYELNKLIEQAKGWLPTNAWLQGQLTSNMNLTQTCNAFYSPGAGTVNFYRSGGGCRNTGEIAAVFDHEWGHGMDDNDTIGALSNSSEGYADVASIYRLQASCVGHGFFQTANPGCGMTSDGTGFNANEALTGPAHCVLDCSGVRDTDWDKHADHLPDTPLTHSCPRCTTGTGPCGRQVHCTAAPVRQAAWDLVARDLVGAPFNMTNQTAFMLGNKLFYEGSGNIGSWHTCTCTTSADGCNADSGYLQWLAADDDNGNINDGTPHMTALFNAYNRHGIACATPAAVNSGCSGQPTEKAAVWVIPGSSQNTVNWDPIAGVTKYWVFRTEGYAGCLFGKARIAQVNSPGTTFVDTGVLPGRVYSYNVVPVGSTDDCFGTMSRCVQATPLP